MSDYKPFQREMRDKKTILLCLEMNWWNFAKKPKDANAELQQKPETFMKALC